MRPAAVAAAAVYDSAAVEAACQIADATGGLVVVAADGVAAWVGGLAAEAFALAAAVEGGFHAVTQMPAAKQLAA